MKSAQLFVLTMALGTFVVVLDNTIMNVSITALVKDLNTTVSGVQTAVALNALMMAAFVLLGGKLGDIMGLKKTFITGSILYIIGSSIASLSNNLGVFILGWCLIQGVGAALMMPNVQSLIRTNVQGDERAKAYGMLGGVNALGTAIGPIVGGFLTAYFSWRWAFRIEVLSLVILLLMQSNIPKDVLAKVRPKLDWVGATLQAFAMIAMVTSIMMIDQFGFLFAKQELSIGPISLTPFGLSPTIILMGAGIIGLMLFKGWETRREQRKESVLLDLKLFMNSTFNRSLIVRSLQVTLFVGLLFTVPLFLQVTYGLDAFQTGLIMLPFSLTIVLAIPSVLRLAKKFSPKQVVRWGFMLGLLGSVMLAYLIQASESQYAIIPGLIVFAIGMAMIASQMANFVMSSVTEKQTPEASGVMSTFEQIGNSVGVAILGTVLTIVLTNSLLRFVPQSTVLTSEEKQKVETYVSTTPVQIVSDDDVFNKVTQTGATDESSQELVSIYTMARTNAFQATMAFVAFFCLAGLIMANGLPKKKLSELATAEG